MSEKLLNSPESGEDNFWVDKSGRLSGIDLIRWSSERLLDVASNGVKLPGVGCLAATFEPNLCVK